MEPVGFWEWFGLLLLLSIPIVNIIVLIVSACGVGKPGFTSFCRAFLLWMLIGVGIVFLYGWLSGGDFPGIINPNKNS